MEESVGVLLVASVFCIRWSKPDMNKNVMKISNVITGDKRRATFFRGKGLITLSGDLFNFAMLLDYSTRDKSFSYKKINL